MKIAVLGLASAMMLSGCATDGIGRGALIGGVGGAAIGAATGEDVVKGAVVGAAAGAVIGYIMEDGKRLAVYRDDNGNRYWVDDSGRRHYTN